MLCTIADIGCLYHILEIQRASPGIYAPFCTWRKQEKSTHLTHVTCNSLLANTMRCFFWLGNQFEFALLMQSIFMILAQVRMIFDSYASSKSSVSSFCCIFASDIVPRRVPKAWVRRGRFPFGSGLHTLNMWSFWLAICGYKV